MNIQHIVSASELPRLVVDHIHALSVDKKRMLNIAIPGGRSASHLILGVSSLEEQYIKHIQLHLVDERLEGERNLDTLMQAGLSSLYKRGLPEVKVPRLGSPLSGNPFDLVYLSIGEDGHFASLFPGSWPQENGEQVCLVENSPKMPRRRVSLSYAGFRELCKNAKVYLLFLGNGKREAFARLVGNQEATGTLPCSYFMELQYNTTIITDLGE